MKKDAKNTGWSDRQQQAIKGLRAHIQQNGIVITASDLIDFYGLYLTLPLKAFATLLYGCDEPLAAQVRDLAPLAKTLATLADRAIGLAQANPIPPTQSSPSPSPTL